MYRARNAFSLLEIGILLVIFGGIAAMATILGGEWVASERDNSTELNLRTIEEAIDAYRKLNGRLPCPADITMTDADAEYGFEAYEAGDTLGVCQGEAGINAAAAGTGVAYGAVPAETLEISPALMRDQWGNLIVYYVTERATQEGSFWDVPKHTNYIEMTDTSAGQITVQDGRGGDRTTTALYALVSHGPNEHGAYDRGGVQQPTTDASTEEVENVDSTPNAILVAKTLAEDFDDIISYKERRQLFNNVPVDICTPTDACTSQTYASCKAMKDAGCGTSGAYELDRDGGGAEAPFWAYCDMDNNFEMTYLPPTHTNMTQANGRTYCSDRDMHLVVFDDNADAQAFADMMNGPFTSEAPFSIPTTGNYLLRTDMDMRVTGGCVSPIQMRSSSGATETVAAFTAPGSSQCSASTSWVQGGQIVGVFYSYVGSGFHGGNDHRDWFRACVNASTVGCNSWSSNPDHRYHAICEWDGGVGSGGSGCATAVVVTPGSQDYTTPGTYSFTIPAYNSLTVTVGGGGGGGNANKTSDGNIRWAGGGGTSSFDGTVVGNGGSAGGATTGSTAIGGNGGSASGGDTNMVGAKGGNAPTSGPMGIGGAGGGPEAGNGGNGQPTVADSSAGAAGGGGGWAQKTFSSGELTPGTDVTVIVGGGGTNGLTDTGTAGQVGQPGSVSITWN